MLRLPTLLAALWLATAVCAPTSGLLAAEVWVLVDTNAETLTVMRDEQVVRVFRDIAIGRGGTARQRKRGDETTPLGDFRVTRVDRRSPFHIFIGLDYPASDQAEWAYRDKIIDRATYQSIRDAIQSGGVPPQNTVLGGHIGIHGLGPGDPDIHRRFNWTRGCVALTNEQIDALAGWVSPGTLVIIR